MKALLMLLVLSSLSTTVLAVDMRLRSVDGSKHHLSDYRGKWVVVNYWATWCPPCIVEMPELQSFHNDNADKNAMVIGINTELISREKLALFLDDYFITYPNFVSRPGRVSELGDVPGLPTTFMVSPDGEVVARQVGPVTREMLEKFIAKHSEQ